MGRAIMFMMFMWIATIIAGNMMQGDMEFSRTKITSIMTAADDHIHVSSTSGFPTTGVVQVDNEIIAYSGITSTTFTGSVISPMVRGAQGTDATSHKVGAMVSTVPGAIMNGAATYNIAVITDTAGATAFVSVPIAVFRLIGSFLFLPLSFLGTDLQILTIVWAVFGVGTLISITIQMAGGRRI